MSSQLTTRAVGDAVPERLAAYYEAADAGLVEDAADQLAENVIAGLPRPGENEVEPRRIIRGREGMRAWLRDRGLAPARHELLFCATEGAACLVEGRMVSRETGEPTTAFVSSFRMGNDRRIDRYVAYACEPYPELPYAGDGVPGDARQVVDAYFHHLDAGEFESAVDQFSPGVTYNHPPYRNTGITSNRRIIFRGHHELLEAFHHRGKASFAHRMLDFMQRGPNAMFRLVVEGMPGDTAEAVSTLSLGEDGRIERYIAFMTVEAVPQS